MRIGWRRIQPITIEQIDQAEENLIQRRVTHLDQLADKLREDRVRRIIEPMLSGTTLGEVPDDDRQYLAWPFGASTGNPCWVIRFTMTSLPTWC
ncbi:hypothetical protein ABC977_17050 [Thioalkalicoccus limnaeus]|uniref:Uncharacterized protein n=1 Tax=Thioalkalicoccus limnaeus TaxID=120681 RepID=A0ABV4BHY6_9GAMM